MQQLRRCGMRLKERRVISRKSNGQKLPERHAAQEIKDGFPVLMGQMSVSLWSALEACMSSFAVHWVFFRPELLSSPPLCKVKVAASALALDDKLQVAELVLDEYEGQHGGALKAGVGRFAFLSTLRLNVPIADELVRHSLSCPRSGI